LGRGAVRREGTGGSCSELLRRELLRLLADSMDSERDRRKFKALVAAEKAQAASSLAKALTVALSKEREARSGAELTLIKKNAELAKTVRALSGPYYCP